MYVERVGETEYVRLEPHDWDELRGRKVRGYGTVRSYTNAVGEHHPAVIGFYGSDEKLTPHELRVAEFADDGGRGPVDLDWP